MRDERCDSFNEGYDAHDSGEAIDSYGNDHVASYFEDGWRTACHYNAGGSYDELLDGLLRRCGDHGGGYADRAPTPGYKGTCTGGRAEILEVV